MSIESVHHVQVLCPAGGETSARTFYHELLGLQEIDRPQTLQPEGVWFRIGAFELHVGVQRSGDEPTRSRAHFALRVTSLRAMIERLRSAGAPIFDADPIPGWDRIYTADPFGNRIELLEIIDGGASR